MRIDLRESTWLTAERGRVYCTMALVGYCIIIFYTYWTANGLLDAFGRPIGTDFSNIWTAGTWVLEGRPEAPFDPELHAARQWQIFQTPDKSYFGWHYPPIFLAVAALLALLPYIPALVTWQLATLPLYLAVVAKIIPGRLSLLAAAAFPAVLVNLLHGHNGFLTAGLVGGALIMLPRNPTAAGILFGLLAYKPQFAIAIPIALIAGGHWRAFFTAGLTAVVAAGLSWIAFGTETWAAFFKFSEFTRTVVLEQGGTGWHKIQSIFSVVRMHGGSITHAYAAQFVVTGAVVALLFCLWRSKAPYNLKAAALCVATLLSTPYVMDYDLVVLGPALAFLVAQGRETDFLPYEKFALACVWAVPMFARTLGEATGIHFGLIALIALFALTTTKGLGQPANRQEFAHG